jgi:hypothetical protein
MSITIIVMITVLASVIGGILYRLGGKQGFNTKYRDLGVPAVFVVLMALFGAIKGIFTGLSLIPCFGLMFAALTTYHYFLPKPPDYKWYHYAMHGFFCSLAAIFYAWASGNWLWFGVRVGINTVFISAWSYWIGWDDLEEFGRGACMIATVPLLLIP